MLVFYRNTPDITDKEEEWVEALKMCSRQTGEPNGATFGNFFYTLAHMTVGKGISRGLGVYRKVLRKADNP